MKETKIQFKALRECVGLSQSDLARLMDVNVRSVRRWESASYDSYHAPAPAWELLQNLLQRQKEAALSAAEVIEEQKQNFGKSPKVVNISYWRNQEDYDKCGRDKGSYLIANTNSRAAAQYVVINNLCDEVQFLESGKNDNNN